LPDIVTSLSLDHEGDHPCQNLGHQQHSTDAKYAHQCPELTAILFGAATHVQSKVTLDQVQRERLALVVMAAAAMSAPARARSSTTARS
jgi:hypothetical protein